MSLIRRLLLLTAAMCAPLSRGSFSNFMTTIPKAGGEFVESVTKGLMLGRNECRAQFRWDVWNCPDDPPHAAPTQQAVTREASFSQAIRCAGVVYTVVSDCSAGVLPGCRCDPALRGKPGGYRWNWGGCSDNVRFGERVSRLFLDDQDEAADINADVRRHNHEAGRRALRKSMVMHCKCHGATGSCTLKTCWRKLPSFSVVGDALKTRYNRAVYYVNVENGGLRKSRAKRRERAAAGVRDRDLVYLEDSPDYCTLNGTHLTQGRECLRTREGETPAPRRARTKSCQRLCKACGLRVRKSRRTVHVKCKCKFHWCCEVRCETCTQTVDSFYCRK